MQVIIVSVGLLVASGVAALFAARRPALCQTIGQLGLLCAAVVGLFPAVRIMVGGKVETLSLPWTMPGSALSLGIDALSAFFLIVIFGLSIAVALFGRSYLTPYESRKSLGAVWFFLNLLVASMVGVVIARDALVFLLTWEVMALCPFFLVAFDDENPKAREAAWIYLVATHLGTAFLLVMFLLLGEQSGALGFDGFAEALQSHPGTASAAFLLAIIGFGSKAGFVPMHVWLPEAHPAAPSHVSALMSGAMIKIGIYGLIRTLTLLGPIEPWWGWLLVAIGASSGILGVVFALAQHDLKRLLAYHSVENIGIITLGLGIGVVGLSDNAPAIAGLGFAAALIHTLNHSLFKGLLFLGAGAIQSAIHILDIEALGGLARQMPWTAGAFLTGSVAIVGLPPLNGFIGEFLLFLAAFAAIGAPPVYTATTALLALASLGLISGLAAACFAKAFGAVFLGAPKNPRVALAHEVALPMRVAMALLVLACLAIGLAAPWVLKLMVQPIAVASGLAPQTIAGGLVPAGEALKIVAGTAVLLIILTAAIWWLRRAGLARHGLRRAPTWGCGYVLATPRMQKTASTVRAILDAVSARATPRMQYTASSFARSLTKAFAVVLRTVEDVDPPVGYFPKAGAFHSHTPDVFQLKIFGPIAALIRRGAGILQWLQNGSIHLYVLYIALTLLALLVWESF